MSSLRHEFAQSSSPRRTRPRNADAVLPDTITTLETLERRLEEVIRPKCPLCRNQNGAILQWHDDPSNSNDSWEGCIECLRARRWDRANVSILVPACCCQCGRPAQQEQPLLSVSQHEWICSNCDSLGRRGPRAWRTQWPPCCLSPKQLKRILALKVENALWLQNIVATDIAYATGFIGEASALNRACLRGMGVRVFDGFNAFSISESLRKIWDGHQQERRIAMLIWGAPHPRSSDSSYIETERWSDTRENPEAILRGLTTLIDQTKEGASPLYGATCLVTSPTTPSYQDFWTRACAESPTEPREYSKHGLNDMDAEPLRYRPKASDRTLSVEISPQVMGIIHPPLDEEGAQISLSTLVRQKAEDGLVVFLGEYDFTLSLTTICRALV